jgi:hypothetical protein
MCENWSLILTEEHRLWASEKRVLWRIFGPKTGEVNRRLEKLRNLYSSPDVIRVIKLKKVRWVEYEARMQEKRNACRVLVEKSEETTWKT